jgi:single-strand DNA-binding protein
MNFNKAIIAGRVTVTPELRTTPNGQAVTTISVATNRTWTSKDGQKQEDVEFHNVVLWGRQAEVATSFLQKGSLVLVEGRLATRTWQDKDGVSRKSTEIIAEHLELGPNPHAKSASGEKVPKELADEEVHLLDDGDESRKFGDVPF